MDVQALVSFLTTHIVLQEQQRQALVHHVRLITNLGVSLSCVVLVAMQSADYSSLHVALLQLLQTADDLRVGMQKRRWILPRSTDWFENYVCDVDRWDEQRFQERYRVSRAMAEALVADLHPYLARKNTRFRKALCVRKIVYMSLDRLAHIGPWHKFNEEYAVGKSSAIRKFRCFCKAAVALYMPDVIRWPTAAEIQVRWSS